MCVTASQHFMQSIFYAVRQYFCRQAHGSYYDDLADFGIFGESKRRDQEPWCLTCRISCPYNVLGSLFSLSLVIVWQNTPSLMQSRCFTVLAASDSSVKLNSSGSQQHSCPVCPTMMCSQSCGHLSLLGQSLLNHFCSMQKVACCTVTQMQCFLAMLPDTLAW